MTKKKSLLILGIIAGIIIPLIGMSFGRNHLRGIGGICIFANALIPVCVNRLYRISYEKEFPDLVEKEKIEYQDERNTAIRNMAKAKSADMIQWCILFTAGLVFVTDCPLWLALVLLGIYFLKSGIEWYYINKFQKQM